ncbi:hypothetical protein H696_00136 [Fonticula alba]|uniref:UBX domain-containing protein n=1 Tax=Fonticula alba TaxID=691883 RepID=A0A058ZDV6_FONAL|nr:hypothetical protein H696_00136 [Fonticula alba]KCV72544.1 hypothetical protein H696_00136 [Fonticula alba]|eukprot:XP_009492245.1 hypothetical protein H696_00136 [Fonticula alba]
MSGRVLAPGAGAAGSNPGPNFTLTFDFGPTAADRASVRCFANRPIQLALEDACFRFARRQIAAEDLQIIWKRQPIDASLSPQQHGITSGTALPTATRRGDLKSRVSLVVRTDRGQFRLAAEPEARLLDVLTALPGLQPGSATALELAPGAPALDAFLAVAAGRTPTLRILNYHLDEGWNFLWRTRLCSLGLLQRAGSAAAAGTILFEVRWRPAREADPADLECLRANLARPDCRNIEHLRLVPVAKQTTDPAPATGEWVLSQLPSQAQIPEGLFEPPSPGERSIFAAPDRQSTQASEMPADRTTTDPPPVVHTAPAPRRSPTPAHAPAPARATASGVRGCDCEGCQSGNILAHRRVITTSQRTTVPGSLEQDASDSFYELNNNDLGAVLSSLRSADQEALKTRAMRDKERQETLAKFPATCIRFMFAERFVLEIALPSNSPVSLVHQTLLSLARPEIRDQLLTYTTPPRTPLVGSPGHRASARDPVDLFAAGLTPAAIVHVGQAGVQASHARADAVLLPEHLATGRT